MTRSRSLFTAAAALATVALLAPAASAGYRVQFDVVINSYGGSGGYVWGSLLDARASADPNAYLGCELYTNAGSTYTMVWCEAQTSTAQSACYSSDPMIADVVRTLGRNSFLQYTYDGSGRCTFVRVNNGTYLGLGQSERAAW